MEVVAEVLSQSDRVIGRGPPKHFLEAVGQAFGRNVSHFRLMRGSIDFTHYSFADVGGDLVCRYQYLRQVFCPGAKILRKSRLFVNVVMGEFRPGILEAGSDLYFAWHGVR